MSKLLIMFFEDQIGKHERLPISTDPMVIESTMSTAASLVAHLTDMSGDTHETAAITFKAVNLLILQRYKEAVQEELLASQRETNEVLAAALQVPGYGK